MLINLSVYFLSLYGDVIAEKTGLGGTWVEIALLATVTSLPELVTVVSAVTCERPEYRVRRCLGLATEFRGYGVRGFCPPLLANVSPVHLVTIQSRPS